MSPEMRQKISDALVQLVPATQVWKSSRNMGYEIGGLNPQKIPSLMPSALTLQASGIDITQGEVSRLVFQEGGSLPSLLISNLVEKDLQC